MGINDDQKMFLELLGKKDVGWHLVGFMIHRENGFWWDGFRIGFMANFAVVAILFLFLFGRLS